MEELLGASDLPGEARGPGSKADGEERACWRLDWYRSCSVFRRRNAEIPDLGGFPCERRQGLR